MCAPSFLVCAHLTTCVRAQLRGDIGGLVSEHNLVNLLAFYLNKSVNYKQNPNRH